MKAGATLFAAATCVSVLAACASNVHRMQSNTFMTGTLTARYTNAGPDSIFHARTEARRVL